MAVVNYIFSIRNSNNTTTDNRITGLSPTISDGKTISLTPATVTQSGKVSWHELIAGDYVVAYDAEVNGDATFPVDWGASLPNPNDRYGTLVLTRDSGRIISNLDAQVSTRSTFAGGAVASVNNLIGVELTGGTVSSTPAPTLTSFTATGNLNTTQGSYTKAPQSVLFQSGANNGLKYPVSVHTISGSNHAFEVSVNMDNIPAPTDIFILI